MSPFSDSKPVEISSEPLQTKSGRNNRRFSNNNPQAGPGCLLAFCTIFTAVGLALFVFLFAIPVSRVLAARSWPSVPCRITSSVLSSHSGSKGSTYSADIVYTYNVDGQTYHSGRNSFGKTKSTSNYKGQLAIVNAYPPGSTSTCFYDPNNPGEAVLRRGMTGDIWLGLISLPFLLFGLLGMTAAIRSWNGGTPKTQWKPSSLEVPETGPLVLQSATSPLGRFIGLGFVNAFWNGIVCFGFFNMVADGGGFAIFGTLFFIPFLLVGGLLFVLWLQAGLALANAKPMLTLSQARLRPGESAELQFQMSSGFMPTHLEIILEGREEATFTRGTDTITDKSTFYLETISQSTGRSGSCMVTIPHGTMHSFEAPRNKIVWMLRANGPIPRWPDISEEWKITVEPGR